VKFGGMKEGHIWIDGVITNDYHTQVNRQLKANADADVIVLHIQSPGGSVYAGYNTYHLLKSSGKKIRTIIEGEAQSIATFIALAGDTVEIRNPSVFMIHNPFAPIEGDADTMLNGASELRNIENDMANIYAVKTRKPIEQIKEMMKKETAMNATQAVEFGFADRVLDSLRMVAIGNKKIEMENKEVSTASLFDDFKNKVNSLIDGLVPKAEAAPGIEAAPVQEAPISAALPEGEYTLMDGTVIKVDASGMIIEAIPVAPAEAPAPEAPMEEPVEDKKDDDKEMLASIQAQLDEMKKKYEMSEAKAETAIQALGTIKNEFETLRKKTVGNDKAPKAAATFTKEPSASEAPTEMDELAKVIAKKMRGY
jgi:ATP-dependent Clp endopeptidase proteolytic subunit ClpP